MSLRRSLIDCLCLLASASMNSRMGGSPGLVRLAHFRDAVQEHPDLSEADRAGDSRLRADCQGGGSLRRGKRKVV